MQTSSISASNIGRKGQNLVSSKLSSLGLDKYFVLDNLLLPSSGRGTTDKAQVDHVVVSNYGVFCIETKSLYGSIYGGDRFPLWLRYLSGRKERFYNPKWQNYGHMKALEKVISSLSLSVPIIVYGLVAFPYAYSLKVSDTTGVGTIDQVTQWIRSFSRPVISNQDKYRIIEALRSANVDDEESRQNHYRQVEALKASVGR